MYVERVRNNHVEDISMYSNIAVQSIDGRVSCIVVVVVF